MKKREKASKAAEEIKTAQNGEKMTIYDYERKYTHRSNARAAKFLVRFVATVVGIMMFVALFFISKEVYDMNKYAGYAVGAASVLVFLFLYIVPVARILGMGYFVTNVNAKTARAAQKHNRKLRRRIAEKMIDVTAKVDGVGWYDSAAVGRLAIALKTGDEEKLKTTLTELYTGSVKKSAKELIMKSSLRSAAYSALSQTAKVDAVLVVIVNIQLIKDLVFLYGFRPSDAKLVKIFATVLHNSLVAYGLSGMHIGSSVAQSMGNTVRSIPILGTAIAAIVDSSVQGLANGTLTTVIGYQTIKYLNKEYKLQNILDGVDVSESQEEFDAACKDLEKELKRERKLAKSAV